MKQVVVISFLGAMLLSGCDLIAPNVMQEPQTPTEPAAVVTPEPSAPIKTVIQNTGDRVSASKLDVASAQERKDAVKTVAKSALTSRGTAVASLGNPAETGFWAKTSLVTKQTEGQIKYAQTGETVNVTLIPRDGGGDGVELSLSAMRTLGAPLTGLPTVEVFTKS